MAQVISDTLLIGDQKTLYFRSFIPKEDNYQFVNPGRRIIEGVEQIGSPKLDTLSFKDGLYELRSSIIVTSFDSGSYILPPFKAIHFKADGSNDTILFEGTRLEYSTIQIDTASFTPFEIKDQLNYPFSIKETFPWIGLLILLIALFYSIKYLFKKYLSSRKDTPIKSEPEDIVSLSINRLEELKRDRLWLKDQKLFYTELTDILRNYIEIKYGIYAMEMTSAQIVGYLKGVFDKDSFFGEFEEMFNLADLIKFAKYNATDSQAQSSIDIAVSFINKTKDGR